MSGKYNLDLKTLLADLESVIPPACSERAGEDKER